MLEVKLKKLHPDAEIPVFKTVGSAGCDVKTIENVTIQPGEIAMIKTGIAIELPEGYFTILAPRGSLCLKQHLHMPHSLGIMDNDFRGEYIVPLRNAGSEPITIAKGERIAQIIFLPYLQVKFNEVSELTDTERGSGSFGSTGAF